MSSGPIMIDIEGYTLTPADRSFLCNALIGGVILFARNYKSPEQLTQLINEIHDLRDPRLLVAVDHEGGRIQRFINDFTRIPPMRYLGHYYDKDKNDACFLTEKIGWITGSELRAVGVDLCFAPCVDIDRNLNDVIGNRAFHLSPKIIRDLAASFCKGLKKAGMASIAKHFPGHGGVSIDSHHALPLDNRSITKLMDDIYPYEALNKQRAIAGIMMSHVLYPKIDSLPAGFSSIWIEDYLRSHIGFDGAIFSDDLNMKAAAGFGSLQERAKIALTAGCDMILICNDRSAAKLVVKSIDKNLNPFSMARLAKLYGVGNVSWKKLLGDSEWIKSTKYLQDWLIQSGYKI